MRKKLQARRIRNPSKYQSLGKIKYNQGHDFVSLAFVKQLQSKGRRIEKRSFRAKVFSLSQKGDIKVFLLYDLEVFLIVIEGAGFFVSWCFLLCHGKGDVEAVFFVSFER